MTTSESKEGISLDDEHIRAKRAINQYQFYFDTTKPTHITKTYGHSLTERWGDVRQAIIPPDEFPQITEQEVHSQSMLSRTLDDGSEDYPDLKVTAQELLPNLSKTIDECEEVIENLPPEKKAEAGRRLATVLLVLGITIHPSIDGNGQTFKCVALSYLHQFDPSLRDSFFPIKYSQLLMQPDRDLTIRFKDIIADLNLPDLTSQSEEDQKVIKFMDDLGNLIFDSAARDVRIQKQTQFLMEHKAILLQLGVQGIKKNDWGDFQFGPIRDAVESYLLEKGYYPILVHKLIQGFNNKNENTTYALHVLLKEPDRKYLRQYIETGTVDLPPTLDADSHKILETVLDIFTKQETDIINLLSRNNKDEIQKQYLGAQNYTPLAEAQRKLPYSEWESFKDKLPTRAALERKRTD